MKNRNQYIFARNKKVRINKFRLFIALIVLVAIIVGAIFLITGRNQKDESSSSSSTSNQIAFTAEQRQQGIEMMIAARGYVYSGLTYDPSYFDGGYPPVGRGVCTDVIWHGFEGIDVVLKDLVDMDIAANFDAYSDIIDEADPSIDFRNVPVLERFFERKAGSLTTNVRNILAWQPGDIVVFESSHIAMVSSLRNHFGEPFIIQHGHDPAADEDRINASDGMEISAHFRWPLNEG